MGLPTRARHERDCCAPWWRKGPGTSACCGAALTIATVAFSLALAVSRVGAQDTLAAAPIRTEGPLTAWCDPGQVLIGGGFVLAPALSPVSEPGQATFVAASHPTLWRDDHGAVAQVGWTAIPNTLASDVGPLTAYALCAGDAATAPPSAPLPRPPVAHQQPHMVSVGQELPAPDVVARVAPAVVTVLAGQDFGNGTTPRAVRAGSGFFLDREGRVLTNAHVVAGGVAFVVILANGRVVAATLIGADPISDLAVLHVEAPVPAVVRLGSAEALRPGQSVLALGSPGRSFTNTVTQGIVSALDRTVVRSSGEPELLHVIQHDAAINPGSSGGPLVTLSGEVVGINTLGIIDAQGIFFAVPSSTITRVTDELIARGAVAYPDLGATLVALDDQTIHQWALPVRDGCYVTAIVPDGPAAAAGLQPGDIVTAINLERVGNRQSLIGVLFRYQPGETVQVTVQRGLITMRVNVTLTQRPADP